MGTIPRPETTPAPRLPAASALSARALGRLTRQHRCPRCDDTGSVWVVCPDAGAVKLACECRRQDGATHVGMVDAGLAVALVACCGAAYLLF